MATTAPFGPVAAQPADTARVHFVLRFSVATTAVFVLCEWMGWQPSALAPVLTAVLLSALPASPPPKVGLGLVVVMAALAWIAFFLTRMLGEAPHILFGLIGLIMFLAFSGLARAKGQLPLTLLLICFAVIPVTTLTLPAANADIFPRVLARAMGLAVIFTWIAYAIWPAPSPKPADPPAPAVDSPVITAVLGTATVLPVMLVYMLYGITDAIPVLLTTVLLVAQMAVERSAASARAKMLGNFIGGIVAFAAFYVLHIAPTLVSLALITFIIGFGFAQLIVHGGVRGGNALLGFNMAMVILGLALLKGDANSGTWISRLVQFGIACAFAVGMMRLLMPLAKAKRRPVAG
jgi:hypothetical protein